MVTRETQQVLKNGAAAAAILAAGIGSFILGLVTTLAAMSEAVASGLNWYRPAGPLSGKTSLAVIVWLVAWVVFHTRWKDTQIPFNHIFIITLVLIGLGLLLTFPPIFEAFE